LNPDTILNKSSLQILLEHAEKNSIYLMGGKTLKDNGNIHNTVVRFPTISIGLFEFTNLGKIFGVKKGHQQFYYEDIKIYKSKVDIRVEALGGAYLLAKLKSFKSINGFDEDYFMYLEDVDLGLRAYKAGLKVMFCPHSEIEHVGGASSTNKHHIRHQAWYDSRRIYFRKHHGNMVNMFMQPLYVIEELLLKLREHYL
jgi:GT2 family glycosyltransferase